MKKVLVMSIPHTGTEFVTNYLGFMNIMPLRFVKPMKDQIFPDVSLVNIEDIIFLAHPSKYTDVTKIESYK